ncbi:MAG: hypothetical protein R6U98_04925 [Pirellulaceae bacterium]
METRPTQAVLPLVGLAADKVIRDRDNPPINSLDQETANKPHRRRPFQPSHRP